MKVVQNRSWSSFQKIPTRPWFKGTRLKRIRHQTLKPGGRAEMTLFVEVEEGGRPHPSMSFTMPPAEDPNPGAVPALPAGAETAPAAELGAVLERAVLSRAFQDAVGGADLADDAGPSGSKEWFRHSIRAQRVAAYFASARDLVARRVRAGSLPASDRDAALYAVACAEDLAYAGSIPFDDADTGTYHSFGHDAPFVHYLEKMIEALPEEGTEDFAAMEVAQQEGIRRQKEQAQNHLDYLMRHKYANHGIEETDIERSLGGFLIDTQTRRIVSETPDSADDLVPEFELLRIEPTSGHPQAGAWIYRDGKGGFRLQDHSPVDVDEDDLMSVAVDADELTFRRAPDDPNLREGVRFEWDGNGYLQQDAIGWIGWAGHCDIKAIVESLGCVLQDGEKVVELCAETREVTEYDNAMILEMLTSMMELGSVYARLDGGGRIMLGKHLFGGARNDSRPDRIQFMGFGQGRHFRWPLGGRQDAFRITRLERGGEAKDLNYAFFRYLPDAEAVSFRDNPDWLKTVEGDYSLISVQGAKLEARVKLDKFDERTGYPIQETDLIHIDLTGSSDESRFFLGTYLADAAARQIYRFYVDVKEHRIVGALDQWEKKDGKWQAREVNAEAYTLPLQREMDATLSREMKRDDPRAFQALITTALREAQNICADTDSKAEVWNGVVTHIDAERLAANHAARTERWRFRFKARFGSAVLDYLVRRDAQGEPEAYCPVKGEDDWEKAPDFLWQDHPHVSSKAVVGGHWVVNETMVEREIVFARPASWAGGEVYVFDEQIKSVMELIFAAVSGHRWTVLHANKRYGFTNEADWDRARRNVRRARTRLDFE